MIETMIDNAFDLARMVARTPGGTPNAGNAEFAATTLHIMIGAIDLSPSMAATDLNTPAIGFGIP
jgi:hypothetical protein